MKKLFIAAFAALLLVAFTAPVMAKVDIGGIVFTDVVWYHRSAENVAGGRVQNAANFVREDSDQLHITIPNISRFKFTFSNEDNVKMYIEVGFQGDNETALSGQSDTEILNLREGWGEWKATENLEIRFGYGGTMLSQLSPQNLIGVQEGFNVVGVSSGNLYSGRVNQLRFTFRMPWNPKDRFAIAFVNPARWAVPTVLTNARDAQLTAVLPAKTGGTVHETSTMPRIDVALPLHFGPVNIYPSAMWAESSYSEVAPGSDDSVTTYALSLGLSFAMGPFTFEGEINYVENPNNQDFLVLAGNMLGGGAHARTYASGGNTHVADTEWLGWWVDLGFKVAPATIHFILGNASFENDVNPNLVNDNIEYDSWMYGVSIPIPVAKGVVIRPELMIYDWADDNLNGANNPLTVDMGKSYVAGVQFMVAF